MYHTHLAYDQVRYYLWIPWNLQWQKIIQSSGM